MLTTFGLRKNASGRETLSSLPGLGALFYRVLWFFYGRARGIIAASRRVFIICWARYPARISHHFGEKYRGPPFCIFLFFCPRDIAAAILRNVVLSLVTNFSYPKWLSFLLCPPSSCQRFPFLRF